MRRIVDDGDVIEIAAKQRQILDVKPIHVRAVVAPQNGAFAGRVDVLHQRAAINLDGRREDDDFEHAGYGVEELLEEGAEGDVDVGECLAHGVCAAGDVEVETPGTFVRRVDEGFVDVEDERLLARHLGALEERKILGGVHGRAVRGLA